MTLNQSSYTGSKSYRLSWLQDFICHLPSPRSPPHPTPPLPSPPLPSPSLPLPSPSLPSPPLPTPPHPSPPTNPSPPLPSPPLPSPYRLSWLLARLRPGAYGRPLLSVCPEGESGDAPSQWQQNSTTSFIKIL